MHGLQHEEQECIEDQKASDEDQIAKVTRDHASLGKASRDWSIKRKFCYEVIKFEIR